MLAQHAASTPNPPPPPHEEVRSGRVGFEFRTHDEPLAVDKRASPVSLGLIRLAGILAVSFLQPTSRYLFVSVTGVYREESDSASENPLIAGHEPTSGPISQTNPKPSRDHLSRKSFTGVNRPKLFRRYQWLFSSFGIACWAFCLVGYD